MFEAPYTVSFDFAAVGIYLVLILSFLRKKKVVINENMCFMQILAVSLIASILDIAGSIMYLHVDKYPVVCLHVVMVLYFCFRNASTFIFALYIISMSGKPYRELSQRFRVFFSLPLFVLFLLIATSYYTGLIYRFSAEKVYYRGHGQFILYLVSGYYLLFGLVYTMTQRILPIGSTVQILLTFTVIGCSCIYIYVFYPHLLIENFGIALSILIVLVLIQRPEDYLDAQVGTFNIKTFAKMFHFSITHDTPEVIIVMYLEDMKLLNSVLGPEKVVNYLQHIARYLELIADRKVFYLESNTFAVMLPDSDTAVLEQFIARIEERFMHEWNDEENNIFITNRFLTVRIPDDTANLDTFFSYIDYLRSLDRSQHWMLSSKDIHLADPRHNIEVKTRLHNALSESKFTVHYQPIISVHSGKVVSAEALIRIDDNKKTFISPSEFIPIAEQNGSILRIGEILFEEVCQFSLKNDLQHLGIKCLEINLSVIQCIQENMASYILKILDNYHINPQFINLEIRKTSTIESPKLLLKNMQILHEHGVQFSLDDFGIGYTTINSLLQLPLSIVKFDKTMIDSATETDKGKVILSSSIAMIKQMGLSIVAEGIETAKQISLLKKMGIDYFQGFYFAKPLAQTDFVRFTGAFNETKEVLEEL